MERDNVWVSDPLEDFNLLGQLDKLAFASLPRWTVR